MADKKNILVVDDSALMRSVLCDIINSDERFRVTDRAIHGADALELLSRKQYDAVVLDVNMPKMTGVELLRELQVRKIAARIMMASTDTRDGAQITLDCLELGALDFVHKPDKASDARDVDFRRQFLDTLYAVSQSAIPSYTKSLSIKEIKETKKVVELVGKHAAKVNGRQIVAIASSTGGPKALQSVIPQLPGNLRAPVVLVQHMPVGFTKSLAERLDNMSELHVREAEEGDTIQTGNVYIARGGVHLNLVEQGGVCKVHYTNEPPREGVRPCANYMYESLRDCGYERVTCVVMTGMGADGTKGIMALHEAKNIHVIAQEESTCAVYGMPKSIVNTGLTDQIVPLEDIAREIIMNVGVK
ncbi:MAG: chemotaxis-specific protein-glutamate methyltransferase CheB [Lachnospiraceae bacterium]|nr:chemotaxis-specific protein-glutamate methyltransferase CheB [Lachnospiraceae bacterium]